ncbi:MAG: hypothetical protein IAE93_13615 [Ignavibacteria bacterium]|nr:hypothetical protein [Ignavibacteria bacterium]
MLDIEKRIADLEVRVNDLESLLAEKPAKIHKQQSLREFFLEINPQKDIQKAATICYYLEKHQGLNSMNVSDLEDGYREAKETVPKDNLAYKFFMLVKKGLLMEAKEKKDGMKAYVLTNTGENVVENKFNVSK